MMLENGWQWVRVAASIGNQEWLILRGSISGEIQ